jgi:hypothetical protein
MQPAYITSLYLLLVKKKELTHAIDKLVSEGSEALQAHNPNPRAQLLYQGHVLNILRRTLAMHQSSIVAEI